MPDADAKPLRGFREGLIGTEDMLLARPNVPDGIYSIIELIAGIVTASNSNH